MATTSYQHIDIDADGVPIIAGTNTKIVEVAVEHLAYNWDAEELHSQHPHLTLGQIHSAMAYYYDHQDEMNQDIERRMQRADAIIQSLGPSSVRLKLQAARRQP
jgi:uncharacterized protein (DUF433 family)